MSKRGQRLRHRSGGESKQLERNNQAVKERLVRREIVATISKWIPERTKNNRAEEIEAVRKRLASAQSVRQ